MENAVNNYTFTIIKDEAVPLAGNFDTVNYAPLVTAVVIGLLLVAVCSYVAWLVSHSRRLALYNNFTTAEVVTKYFLCPAKLLRDELEVEYALAEAVLSN